MTTDGVSPNVRRTWLAVGSVAVVGLVVMGSIEALGLISRTDRTVRESFDAEGIAVLEVGSDNGDVHVIGDGTDEIRVVIRLQESWRRVDRTASVEGDRLVLAASCPEFGIPFCHADYEVHVPPDVRVVARSDNGDTTVRQVRGGTEAMSHNGDVTGEDLAGQVRLSSDNGEVEGTGLAALRIRASSHNGDVRVLVTTAPDDVEATSDNGDVDVVVPRGDAMYAVDATTDNGEATTPIRTDPDGERRITARSHNGDVRVRYP